MRMANVMNVFNEELQSYSPISVVHGSEGVSAYEQSVDNGYQGTEEEFAQRISSVSYYPKEIENIGLNTFLECYLQNKKIDYVTIPENIDYIVDGTFLWQNLQIGTLFIPSTIKTIGNVGFYDMSIDRVIWGAEVIPNSCFWGVKVKEIILLEGVKVLDCVFTDSSGFTEVTIPSSVTDILNLTFRGCADLQTIIFKGTPKNIVMTDAYDSSSAPFKDCPNLTTVKVPWSEGEVEGAPWGATNATFIYNYKGEE